LNPRVKDFVGSLTVMNFLNSTFEVWRFDGVVGLYLFMIFK
jgi:hypothetical protein